MRRKIPDITQWRKWFAWYPVIIGNEWVWWEDVARRHQPWSPQIGGYYAEYSHTDVLA
jgi:hypothetical protein